MSKTITEKLTYPGATVEQVLAMLDDPEFRQQVAGYQQAVRSSADISGNTARLEIVHGTSFAR